MFNNRCDLLQAFLQKGVPFLLSFGDDAILMGLSKTGIRIPFIPRLDVILFSISILYWSSYVSAAYARNMQGKQRFKNRPD